MLLNRILLGTALIAMGHVAASGCAKAADEPRESFDDRPDLSVVYLRADVDSGVTGEIEFEVPGGVESVLIEVRGSAGHYYLSKLVTPLGRDLIEAGQFVTRGARELPGLVTWLYPNSPGNAPEPGTYRMIIRAEDGNGGHVDDDDLDIRIYLKQAMSVETCGLRLDFLVADDAIVAADVEPMVQGISAALGQQYVMANVGILDHTVSVIRLPTSNLDLGGSPVWVFEQMDEVMDSARASGSVRSQAVHIVLVRSLGLDLRGYAMGLPGPMGSDVATSAVLVASSAFVDRDGYLDVPAMTETVAHELGHYLGLYHTSEGDRQFHDPIPDTVECTDTDCPDEFWLNLMTPGTENRTVLTSGQSRVVRRHPLCVPLDGPIDPDTCNLPCTPPTTCGRLGGQDSCLPACDPAQGCANGGTCQADDLGKYICVGP